MRSTLATWTLVGLSLAMTSCYVSRRDSGSFGSADSNTMDGIHDLVGLDGRLADGGGADLSIDLPSNDLEVDTADLQPDIPEVDSCQGDCEADPCAENTCDDGDVCNGEETCDPETGDCLEGESPIVADEFLCTIDECAADTGEISHTPSDEACVSENPCLTGMCDFGSIKADEDGQRGLQRPESLHLRFLFGWRL